MSGESGESSQSKSINQEHADEHVENRNLFKKLFGIKPKQPQKAESKYQIIPTTDLALPSKEKKEYGLFTESGNPILESPTPRQIDNLKSESRIEYFHYRIPGKIIDMSAEERIHDSPIIPKDPYVTPSMIKEKEQDFYEEILPVLESFNIPHQDLGGFIHKQLVTNFLGEQIIKEFLNSKINMVGIRGIAASIDGDVETSEGIVEDIKTIVKSGSERGKDKTLITSLEKGREIHYRTLQWLVQSPQEIRKLLIQRPEDAHKIFPAILVYDLSKMKPGKYNYEAILSPSKRRSIQSYNESIYT